ncbi:hypothetical protein [Paenibacillus sp. y28]|uniref:hypothetical protein n=1 Tax=Paenibacillus sp. y28 TaxID=3129110 RepID=UPI003018DC7E
MRKNVKWLGAILLLLLVLSGCGGGPKSDVTVFVMPENGIVSDLTERLQQTLQSRLGESPTVTVNGSVIFSMEKLVVEIAAGGNGVLILPEDQLKAVLGQGGAVNLEGLLKKEDYPGGVREAVISSQQGVEERQTALFAVPMTESKWFKEAGYKGNPMYAFIPANAPDMDKAKQVMAAIAEK